MMQLPYGKIKKVHPHQHTLAFHCCKSVKTGNKLGISFTSAQELVTFLLEDMAETISEITSFIVICPPHTVNFLKKENLILMGLINSVMEY